MVTWLVYGRQYTGKTLSSTYGYMFDADIVYNGQKPQLRSNPSIYKGHAHSDKHQTAILYWPILHIQIQQIHLMPNERYVQMFSRHRSHLVLFHCMGLTLFTNECAICQCLRILYIYIYLCIRIDFAMNNVTLSAQQLSLRIKTLASYYHVCCLYKSMSFTHFLQIRVYTINSIWNVHPSDRITNMLIFIGKTHPSTKCQYIRKTFNIHFGEYSNLCSVRIILLFC